MYTHEQFVQAIAAEVTSRALPADKEKLDGIKLVFGAGETGLRGVTYYKRWANGKPEPAPFVEVCAFGKESDIQLAGTTIHELGHVVAGWDAGHGKEWHQACARLGLRHCKAAGHEYRLADFEPAIRFVIASLPKPDDGKPVPLANRFGKVTIKPCQAGKGTRGGKSFGIGSGSRLRLFECKCIPAIKVRLARDEFDATCNCCNTGFVRKG